MPIQGQEAWMGKETGEGKTTGMVVVLVTCGSAAEAKRIGRAAVDARVAACVNILPGAVQSIYVWKGKLGAAREKLLLMKTSRGKIVQLRALVERLHSCEVPEFIALPIVAGSPAYLAWLEDSLSER